MTKTHTNGSGRRMHKKKFVLDAIRRLRKPPYSGIHVVWSGFNTAYRHYYGEDPRSYIDQLVAEGIIVKRPTKGGILIFDAKEVPKRATPEQQGAEALATILGTTG